jgi:soluble lytic murein transglycosylase-like protein
LCPGVSAPLLAAQIKAESDWNPNAVSSGGAEGIAQFLPATFAVYWASPAKPDNRHAAI